MLIYNVTLKVDWAVHEQWLAWMVDIHIPEVLETGCFIKNTFSRLLEIDDTEGPTYSSQYQAASRADYDRYMELYAAAMRKSVTDHWGDRCISFRTLMQVIN